MEQRVILALDGIDYDHVADYALEFGPHAAGIKLGTGLLHRPWALAHLAQKHFSCGERPLLLMADLKLWDVSHTLAAHVKRFPHAAFITVNAANSRAALYAAAQVAPHSLTVVTILTEMTSEECEHLHGAPPEHIVPRFAKWGVDCGASAVVCSAKESSQLRKMPCMSGIALITPGIVPAWAPWANQACAERSATPAEAIRAGADWLVIGSAILKAPKPREALRRINEEVCHALSVRAS